jgi:integrase
LGTNPARGVIRFADGKRERRLSDNEYELLGGALRLADAKGIWPPAAADIRFLALTGWRSGEALELRWADIDLVRRIAMLPNTKTGRSVRPLSRASCEMVRNRTRSSDLIFPATRGNSDVIMSGFKKMWKKIAELCKLSADVTPHILRHSFTSLAADLGYSELAIGALVGHKGRTITSRYVHSADTVLLSAADAVAIKTTALMSGNKGAIEVIPFRRESA